jgi:stage V sporulation protein G
LEITEVRIKLMTDSDDRLQAFCSITFDDCFVVRDLKIIEGASGPFVAMPSRKLTTHCPHCKSKNHLRAPYCNNCGSKLKEDRPPRDSQDGGRCKLYADIAHPINSTCREMIQERVIREFETEVQRSREPGYMSRYDDDYGLDDGPDADIDEPPAARQESLSERAQVQPPEKQPRPPHKPPNAARPQSQSHSQSTGERNQQRGNSGFGAGIF